VDETGKLLDDRESQRIIAIHSSRPRRQVNG
jgi:hypothetical protein